MYIARCPKRGFLIEATRNCLSPFPTQNAPTYVTRLLSSESMASIHVKCPVEFYTVLRLGSNLEMIHQVHLKVPGCKMHRGTANMSVRVGSIGSSEAGMALSKPIIGRHG
jgi:hypothetical protein